MSYSTMRKHRRGVHSNNTSSDFALEISFSILEAPLLYLHGILYRKVSLQASHYTFVIVNERE